MLSIKPRFKKACSAQGIAVKLVLVIDARKPRALHEGIGKNFLPQFFNLVRLCEKTMAADIKRITVVSFRAADPADIARIAFQNADFE